MLLIGSGVDVRDWFRVLANQKQVGGEGRRDSGSVLQREKKNKGKGATAEWLMSCHQAERRFIMAHCDITKGSEGAHQ